MPRSTGMCESGLVVQMGQYLVDDDLYSEQFGWSQTEKGLVLSAFFVGYLLFLFVSGLLARRYGGKRVLGCAVIIWSLLLLSESKFSGKPDFQ